MKLRQEKIVVEKFPRLSSSLNLLNESAHLLRNSEIRDVEHQDRFSLIIARMNVNPEFVQPHNCKFMSFCEPP